MNALDYNALVGQRVRELRKQRGLTQEMLSKLMGISGAFVAVLERGERRWTAQRIDQAAKSFSLPHFAISDPSIRIDQAEFLFQVLEQLR